MGISPELLITMFILRPPVLQHHGSISSSAADS
jgi:hypothetical protein